MKPEALLDFAVFQLTPTRTRCELFISSKGESEKVASGLLQPFLAHLRTAEEQIAVGGYSIRLEPPVEDTKAGWFTKATMQRFLRFVSTPQVLERVTAVETELIQLDEELTNYIEGDDQSLVSGGKYLTKYKQLRRDSLAGDEAENDTTKGRLIKALEARYFQLQREQGMAFARAIAAGFDKDHLSDLLAFADCFGAARLSVACHKFATLCKKQEEGGLWLDEMEKVAAEGDNFNYPEANAGITIAPAGLNPLTLPEARQPASVQESSLREMEADADRRSSELRRQSSGLDQQNHPQMMGMPPPYAPWQQGYDPRFFPQGVVPVPVPYVNGGFPGMNPYWAAPPNGHAGSQTPPADDDSDEEEVEKKSSSKKERKSNTPRRKSGSMKRLSVGRGGKRAGMVVIRNINYITPTQDSAAKKNKGTEDDHSDGGSGFETSSEAEEQNGVKKTRHKKANGAEVSSEGSHASTSGTGQKKDSNDESFFTVPARNSYRHSGENGSFNYDMEYSPQLRVNGSPETVVDNSYALHGDGRVNGMKGGAQYGFEDQMKSSNMVSKDGMVMPHRSQGGVYGATNHDSELSYRNPAPVNLNDSHIMPQRTGFRESGASVNVEEPYQMRQQEETVKDTTFEDFFIVPSRPVRESSEAIRRTFELDIPEAEHQPAPSKGKPEVVSFEPEMLPERPKETGERRWNDMAYDMEIMAAAPESKPASEENNEAEEFYEEYHEQRDANIMKEPAPKKTEREARMRSLQENLDKRKAELSSRFKSTRSSIMKSKKEKEEAERKRIEELAAERRNRIAARSGGGATASRASTVSSTASKTRTPTSASSKALSSTGTNNEAKKPLPGRNVVSRSVSSLAELRKENAKPASVRQQGSSVAPAALRRSVTKVDEGRTRGMSQKGR